MGDRTIEFQSHDWTKGKTLRIKTAPAGRQARIDYQDWCLYQY
jgi:hypothetical protein